MKKVKVLIIEAEGIVASKIQSMLEGIGYDVSAIVYSAEEAIKKIKELRPDVVLIDFTLKGHIHSIAVAERIHCLFDIPSVFLATNAAREILQHAELTNVFGHIFTPFIDRELDTNIKLTLHRHKTEVRLKLMGEMLDKSMSGIILSDINDNIIYANETALKKRGYTREDFLLTKVSDLVDSRKKGRYKQILQEVIDKGYFMGEFNIARKDGSLMPVEATLTLVRSGKKDYVISITQDISSRKKIEKEKQDIEYKAQVSSRLALVGEMAAGIAHEINNPLTGVIGFAQILQKREDLPNDVRKKLSIISEGGQRMGEIIGRLLTFARQSKPSITLVDINKTIRSTLSLMRYDMRTSNITVRTKLESGLPCIMADAGQLKQVFLNIVVNAKQEMESSHGGGHLEVRSKLVDNTIQISFKDNGSGIAKKNLEKVFDPFFTTKEVGAGTGLGLSLSHGIIAEHGGRLYVESKEGEGANFVTVLPLTTERSKSGTATDDPVEAADMVIGRILVVDDEKMIRDYLEHMLRECGHHVDVERNARAAVKRLRNEKYDVILADIKMPGMNGREFYQVLQEIGTHLVDRVIFMTGDIIGEESLSFLKNTEVRHITKPFEENSLKVLISEAMSSSRSHRIRS